MIVSCALLSMVLGSIPLTRFMLGPVLAFAFFCWVDSYVRWKNLPHLKRADTSASDITVSKGPGSQEVSHSLVG